MVFTVRTGSCQAGYQEAQQKSRRYQTRKRIRERVGIYKSRKCVLMDW